MVSIFVRVLIYNFNNNYRDSVLHLTFIEKYTKSFISILPMVLRPGKEHRLPYVRITFADQKDPD
jgi:hypothetical protein